ncbi:MAG: flagellar motor switch protein FliM [Limisphaerales bacterium]
MSADEAANPSAGAGADLLPPGGQVGLAEDGVTVIRSDGRRTRCAEGEVTGYDFRQPAFMAPAAVRQVRKQHDEFARALTARLSTYLRLEFSLQLTGLEMTTLGQVLESLPAFTYVGIFKIEPLAGACLFVAPTGLATSIVDRLLGGSAKPGAPDREFSEIEVALLEQTVNLILDEWCRRWSAVPNLRPVLLGHESQPRFVRVAPPETAVVRVTLAAVVGESRNSLQFVLPSVTVEPLFRPYSAPPPGLAAAAPRPRGAVGWNPDFGEVPVRLTATWPDLGLTLDRLAGLKPGDLLLMHPGLVNEVEVALETVPRFHARLGRRGQNVAIEILAPLNADSPSSKS